MADYPSSRTHPGSPPCPRSANSPEKKTKLRTELAARWPDHIPELDLALHTGLRVSEMYGLDWQDVDLARCLVLIRRGKNGDSRYARLDSIAHKALAELRKRGGGTGAIIRNLDGEPLVGPRYWFEKSIKRAGIADFHWHNLRHTFASRLTWREWVYGPPRTHSDMRASP
jgi:integrase